MAQPYVGEIRMFAGNFAPAGWAFCDGRLEPISELEVLFQLIGTTYGGDGQSTFALPDLRGRIPIHQGTGSGLTPRTVGEPGGVEDVTLSVQQIPQHSHPMVASGDIANSPDASNSVLARSPQVNEFINAAPANQMNAQSVTPDGGSQPHTNFQPYLCVNYIISLFGLFPSQT